MVRVSKIKSLEDGSNVYFCGGCKAYLAPGAFYPKLLVAKKYLCIPCNRIKSKQARDNDPTTNLITIIKARQKRRGVPCAELDKSDIKYVLQLYDHRCIVTGRNTEKLTLIPIDKTTAMGRSNAVPVGVSFAHLMALPSQYADRIIR
jgi:hypothetical protein